MKNGMDVFVFGSNLAGIHGAGAAKYARKHCGAEIGVGQGITGTCYALPTKGYDIEVIRLSEIAEYIQVFKQYAREHPDTKFQVTKVGCGLGGWTSDLIAPLFMDSPSNCYFDTDWKQYLPEDTKFWGTL